MNHILIHSTLEKETECEKHDARNLLLITSESNRILTESKLEVQKTLACSKSREGTPQYSEAARFSNNSIDFQ